MKTTKPQALISEATKAPAAAKTPTSSGKAISPTQEIARWAVGNGLLQSADYYAKKAILIQEYDDTPLYSVAEAISAAFPAVQVFFSESSLCVKRGSETSWFLPKELMPSVLAARDIVAYLGANQGKEPPYGIGTCARLLLHWLDSRAPIERDDFIGAIETQHYKVVRPGHYEGFYRQYDLSGAYWQAVSRMPTPYAFDVDGKVVFARCKPQTKQRWEDIKEQVRKNKPLRLALVGRMLGGSASRCFYKGKLQIGRGIGPGKFAPAARLAIRTIYEACYLAATSENSPYCNVDSVITESPRVRVWDELALQYRQEACKGDTTVHAVGAYRIGAKTSGLFDGSSPCAFETPAPKRMLHSWLMEPYARPQA